MEFFFFFFLQIHVPQNPSMYPTTPPTSYTPPTTPPCVPLQPPSANGHPGPPDAAILLLRLHVSIQEITAEISFQLDWHGTWYPFY